MKRLRDLLLITLLFSAPTWAKQLPHDIEPGSSVNDIALPLTKLTAAELAHIETNGKVLSVESQQVDGRTIFRVKVLHNNGKVKFHRFDSETGHAIR